MSSNNFKIQWKTKSIKKSFINPLEFEESSSSLRVINKLPLEVTLDTSTSDSVPVPKKRSLESPSSAVINKRHCPVTSFVEKVGAVPVVPQRVWNSKEFPEFLKKFETDLNSLLWKDTVLQDLADKHLADNVESVEALLAFEAGQGVCINLKRDDGSTLPINIKKNETILGLKKRIRTETERELKCQSERKVNINWKHIWRQNWLINSDKEKLTDDRVLLKDVGLTNNSEIKFLKKLREKQRRKGSKRRQAVEDL